MGYGETRRGYVVTVTLAYSRMGAGALIFSKQAPDILWGLRRCLIRFGGLPETLVWDREGALHAGDGRPTEAFATFCGQLAVGWLFLEPFDPEAKGIVERGHGFLETSFEPGRLFAARGRGGTCPSSTSQICGPSTTACWGPMFGASVRGAARPGS